MSAPTATRLPSPAAMECGACAGDGRGFSDQPCESCAGWGHFLVLPEAEIEALERAGRLDELHAAAGERFGPRAYDQPAAPLSEMEVEAAARAALGVGAAVERARRAVEALPGPREADRAAAHLPCRGPVAEQSRADECAGVAR